MSRYFCFFIISFFLLKLESKEDERLMRINQLRLAFELQSCSRSYEESYSNCVLFNCAQDRLIQLNESKEKLDSIRNLWLWYRMYGYSCGLLSYPVQSPDEYKGRYKKCSVGTQDSNEKLDPKERKNLRDFLAGVGLTISGVFCVTVSPPVAGPFGRPMIMSGFTYMFHAVSNMILDKDEKLARLSELERLQKQAEMSIVPKNLSQ